MSSRRRRSPRAAADRPAHVFDTMLQHERTALAWERTAIAAMAAGLLLARHAASVSPALGATGLAVVGFGAALLVWSGRHYNDLHGPLRDGVSPVHPHATRIVGITTVATTATALAVSVIAVLT